MNQIIAAAVLFQCAHGMLQALTPLRLHDEGAPIVVIGWVAAAHGFGFACGCLATPVLLERIRANRVMTFLAGLATGATVALILAAPVPGWILLRMVTGFATAGLYNICDAWVGTEPDRRIRGRVLSRYMTATKMAAIVAPAGILVMPVTQWPILFATASLFALSALPFVLAGEPRRRLDKQRYAHPMFLLRMAPAACIGAIAAGLLNGSVYALGPVYLSSLQIDNAGIAIILSVFQAGGILSQILVLARLAGRDGVPVLHGLYGIVACASAIALALYGAMTPFIALLLFLLLGSVSLAIYPMALGTMFDRVSPGNLVPAAGAMLLWMALGNLAGPVVCGVVMHHGSPNGMMIYLAGASLSLLVVSLLTKRADDNDDP